MHLEVGGNLTLKSSRCCREKGSNHSFSMRWQRTTLPEPVGSDGVGMPALVGMGLPGAFSVNFLVSFLELRRMEGPLANVICSINVDSDGSV